MILFPEGKKLCIQKKFKGFLLTYLFEMVHISGQTRVFILFS